MFIRKANNVEEFGSFKIVYDYLLMYPVESIEDIKNMFTEWDEILLYGTSIPEYTWDPEPEESINEVIKEFFTFIGDIFVVIFNVFRWCFLMMYNMLKFFWTNVSWFFNLPYWVLGT